MYSGKTVRKYLFNNRLSKVSSRTTTHDIILWLFCSKNETTSDICSLFNIALSISSNSILNPFFLT